MSDMFSSDRFGVTIPAPLEPFTSTIIHPRNLAIQERQQNARKLTRAELVEANQKVEKLRKALDEAGYFDRLGQYKLLKKRYMLYLSEAAASEPESAAHVENLRLMGAVIEQSAPLRDSLRSMATMAAQHQQLVDRLKDHQLAIERERIHNQLNAAMAKEAEKWRVILIETWARLGYSHERFDNKRNKTIVDKVRFSEMVITPDAVWFKIFVTVQAMFGSKSALPKRVRVIDLVDEKTLEELSIACQRQVTAYTSYKNGAWIKVNRIGTTDGLLNEVTLQQLLNSYPHDERELMPIPVGVGEGRNISWIMLAEHPHFLVGGSTGNGKSNLTRAIICTLIQMHSPDELRMCFVDLKDGAEFSYFEKIPHLLMPVVKQVEDAVNVLAQMDALRAERMKQIAAGHCKNILEYNQRYPNNKLPRIVIFIDEYARVKARGKEFEAIADRAVGEITALGRAAGVHLYVATQTPYARVLPGEAKNNMAMRLAFAVGTVEASRSIVGNGDAFLLPQEPKGRAIIAIGSTRWHIQTPHCRNDDIKNALEIADGWEAPEQLIALPETVRIDVFDEDELFDIAVNELNGALSADRIYKYVKDSGTASLSEVREMVKKFRLQPRDVCVDGVWYSMKKNIGGGMKLVKRAETSKLSALEGAPHGGEVHIEFSAEVLSLPSDAASHDPVAEVPFDEAIAEESH